MPKITMYKQAEVEAGAKFLDEKVPGWASRIDPNELDMHWWNMCVLGRLYGDYNDGCAELGLDTGDEDGYIDDKGTLSVVYSLGYNLPGSEDCYPELTETWKAAIRERQEGGQNA